MYNCDRNGSGKFVAGETAVDVAEAPKSGRASWNHGNSMRRGCDDIAFVLCSPNSIHALLEDALGGAGCCDGYFASGWANLEMKRIRSFDV
jgi:hypothetical protein